MTIFARITSDFAETTALPLRPRILIRAALAGQSGWRRRRNLPHLLRCPTCPAPGHALPRLLAEEAVQNHARLTRLPGYDLQRHVLLMIAILAEIRAVSAPEKASPKHP